MLRSALIDKDGGTEEYDMGDRFSRSWLMIRHSMEILQQDRELLVFPLLSSIAAILVLVLIHSPLRRGCRHDQRAESAQYSRPRAALLH